MTQGTLTLVGKPRRCCRRKIPYQTERRARRAALKMVGKYWVWVDWYPCPICPDWHVGRPYLETFHPIPL